MNRRQGILVAVLLALAGALAAVVSSVSDDEQPTPAPLVQTGRPSGGGSSLLAAPAAEELRGAARGGDVAVDPGATTVAFPLEVELELVRAAGLLDAENAPGLGSGASARLRGRINDAAGRGAPCRVTFVAGPNAGRVLESAADGLLGASDLYPGLSIVEVTGATIPGAMRELRLRNGKQALLNIGFGRPAAVYGQVIDRGGEPVGDAEVTMDGRRAQSDERGFFHFPQMASGQVLVFVRKPGYAAYRETYNVTAGQTIPRGRLRYTLERGVNLKVTIPERIGATQSAQLYLMPQFGGQSARQRQRSFPWYTVSPVSIFPGSTVTIDDLPPDRFQALLFHAGARAVPVKTEVNLSSGKALHLVLHIEPAPSVRGVVQRSGRPVGGALVTLELPDRAKGTQWLLKMPPGVHETHVFGNLGVQSALTGSDGRFEFSANEALSGVRYLTASAPRGQGWAGRVLRPGDTEVVLELEDPTVELASLEIETQERHQALPVEVWVNGEPRDLPLLPPGVPLRIEDLQPGVWKISSRWHREVLWDERELEIDDETEWELVLPAGAIEG
ncbi:MAG: carboxypeptidase-like regulatory domain-containing protein [Planctomycetota bacterium]|jgi:hypothetical protein|nr:carboxypeptidase-like regulatory domain-containing protein [Planctomycetota bacterium]MDP6763661.1 carboxypeptidase-like regulatory domain-containing protein [Planctomycetota bacterium]MDP6987930.1 carboxypeptidase-like regulatory domain-containing protein [Planctomycetota bacterium]